MMARQPASPTAVNTSAGPMRRTAIFVASSDAALNTIALAAQQSIATLSDVDELQARASWNDCSAPARASPPRSAASQGATKTAVRRIEPAPVCKWL
jgi:hypothetical protein